MQSRVEKLGDNFTLPIPRSFAEQAGLREDLAVELTLEGDRVVIQPSGKLSLEELVAQITDDNRHEEIDWGRPVGKEVW